MGPKKSISYEKTVTERIKVKNVRFIRIFKSLIVLYKRK